MQIPTDGIKGFQTNRYVVQMIKDKQATSDDGPEPKHPKLENNAVADICNTHKLPLVIFCEEKDCQKLICHTCVLFKHKDHTALEIPDKVMTIKEEIRQIKTAAEYALENNATHNEKLNKIQSRIWISATEALDKIQEEKKSLIDVIEEEAAEHSRKVLEMQENKVKHVEETLHEIAAKKAKLEEIKQISVKDMSENINDLITMLHDVNKLYNDGLLSEKDTEKMIKHYESRNCDVFADTNSSQNQEAEKALDIQKEEDNHSQVANREDVHNDSEQETGRDDIQNDAEQETINNYQTDSFPPQRNDLPVTMVTKVNSWKCERGNLSISHISRIYMASLEEIYAFDLDGNLKMKKNVEHNLRGRKSNYSMPGMTCFNSNGRDMLLLAGVGGNKSLQLRDGHSGDLLDELSIPGLIPRNAMCKDSPSSILVQGPVEGRNENRHRKLMQFIIRNNKILHGCKELQINLEWINSVTLTRSNNKKIIVVTGGYVKQHPNGKACSNRTQRSIVAIDYNTGIPRWKITKPILNGRPFHPGKICTDEMGNLFVADDSFSRVVVIDMQGKIQKEICSYDDTHCSSIENIACIPDSKKLIVQGLFDNAYNLDVYDIKY